jgi:hypothetical protein
MKCTYCGNEIPAGEGVTGEGHQFCNTIHRYSWKQSGGAKDASILSSASTAANASVVSGTKPNGLLRKIIGTIVYTIVSYFLLVILLGALMGGVAGCEAGQNGQDPAEAGRVAGEQFAATYGLFILILCFILSAVGSFKGFLPLTKPSKT